MKEENFSRGLEQMAKINPDNQFMERLKATHPDLSKYIVEFAYGEIYSRPGLEPRSRQIATISALTALGFPKRELKIHIHNALNVGCTKEEIVEIILHLIVYCGFPAASGAMAVALETFSERDSQAANRQSKDKVS